MDAITPSRTASLRRKSGTPGYSKTSALSLPRAAPETRRFRRPPRRATKATRNRLAAWVREQAMPAAEADFTRKGYAARVRAAGKRFCVRIIFLRCRSAGTRMNFGARSAGEPCEARDAAAAVRPDGGPSDFARILPEPHPGFRKRWRFPSRQKQVAPGARVHGPWTSGRPACRFVPMPWRRRRKRKRFPEGLRLRAWP